MLTDRENRPALAVAMACHALSMGCLAILTSVTPTRHVFAGPLAAVTVFLTFATGIAGIAWLVEVPFIRRLNGSVSHIRQFAACVLFLLGMVAVFLAIGATWKPTSSWSFVGLALLSGRASLRQFRQSADDDRPPMPDPMPAARLVE